MENGLSIDEKQINRTLARGCRENFFLFVTTFWSEFINEIPVWNWHIEYLCDELQKVAEKVRARQVCDFDYFIINVPPGSSKSSVISVLYPLWVWTMDPTQRFLCGSYSATIAEDLGDKAVKVFTSQKYQTYFPEVGIRSDAKSRIENKHNAERYAISTGSSATGLHASQIILDDPINAIEATSDAERDTANKWITGTISSRKTDKRVTPTIIVMQRLHEDDPTGYLLSKNLRIQHISLPAELPDEKINNVFPVELREKYTDGLLDSVRLDRETLAKAKEELGSYSYEGQMMQRPVDPKGGLFQREWFEIIEPDYTTRPPVNFQLDTAYTVNTANDPSGILSYYRKNQTVYITNWTSKRLEFPDLCKFVKTHVKAHGYTHQSMIRVEPKASGKSLVQQLVRETNLNIKESDNPDKDKVTRATNILPKCEAGRVKLIKGYWNQAFLDEVCAFPKAKHDESVDCLVEVVRNELIKDQVQDLAKIFSGWY